MSGALTGIRVLDLTRVLAGPLATQFLGDVGADIVKVERPGWGDDTRHYGPHFLQPHEESDGTGSTFFLCANRNKRSVSCDLNSEEGRATILRLAARCDVFVENFTVGTLARYGLDYEAVRKVNPNVIYASLTGYGQDGPYSDRAGYDAVFQAQAGWMSLIGEEDGRWFKTGQSLADIYSGMCLASGILAALYHRDAKGGGGQHLDVGLYDCAVSALSHVGVAYLNSGKLPPRLGNAANGGAPSDIFDCADGTIYISTGRQAHFKTLCAILDCPHLCADSRFANAIARFQNRAALSQELARHMATRDRTELADALAGQGVPAGLVNDVGQVFADPQVQARGMAIGVEAEKLGQIGLIANPIRFSETPVSYRQPPPRLGESNDGLDSLWDDD